MINKKTINYVGCRDVWPVMAKLCTFRAYGPAGTFGFQCAGPENRYFNFGHGGYFSREFISDNWREVLSGADDQESDRTFVRTHPPLVRTLGKLFPGTIPTVALGALFILSPWFEPTVSGAREWVLPQVAQAFERIAGAVERDAEECVEGGSIDRACARALSREGWQRLQALIRGEEATAETLD